MRSLFACVVTFGGIVAANGASAQTAPANTDLYHVHLTKAAAATGCPDPARDLRAWHNDTFVTGPSRAEFAREMGLGGSGAAGAVYIVGIHRPVAGHREQLERALSAPAPSSSKVQSGNVLLTHREGSEWTFATVTRYNSWSDLANDRGGAAADAPGTAGGWNDIREHSAFHRDTIADRIYPAK